MVVGDWGLGRVPDSTPRRGLSCLGGAKGLHISSDGGCPLVPVPGEIDGWGIGLIGKVAYFRIPGFPRTRLDTP